LEFSLEFSPPAIRKTATSPRRRFIGVIRDRTSIDLEARLRSNDVNYKHDKRETSGGERRGRTKAEHRALKPPLSLLQQQHASGNRGQ